jgi:hypothetical protein
MVHDSVYHDFLNPHGTNHSTEKKLKKENRRHKSGNISGSDDGNRIKFVDCRRVRLGASLLQAPIEDDEVFEEDHDPLCEDMNVLKIKRVKYGATASLDAKIVWNERL